MRFKAAIQIIMILSVLLISSTLSGQNPGKYIREGNELYKEKKFNKAETNYLKALESDSTDVRALFNRADALYQQENYSEARQLFEKLTKKPLSENDQASVRHNLGNSFLESKKYKEAVEAYKQALLKNPSDMDTKYNLTYAIKKLKEQQNKQQKKNQNQNQNQNKNKDKKDKQNQQDKQDQQKKNQEKQKQNQNQDQKKKDQQKNQNKDKQEDKKKQQQQPQPRKISKQDAKRMLQALKNSEKNTLKKLKKKKAKGQQVETEKDW